MGLFKGIRESKGTEGGIYFKPGNYVVKVERCKEGKKRNGTPFFVAECLILKTDVKDDDQMLPGRHAAFFVQFADYPELSLGNVGDFMTVGMQSWFLQHNETVPEGFFGTGDTPRVDEVTADEIVSEENTLSGTIMSLEAYNKPTKENKPFTRHRWSTLRNHEAYAEWM